MKKPILSALGRIWNAAVLRPGAIALALAAFGYTAEAQISVYLQQPEEQAGPLEFTYTDGWGADLTDPSTAVTGNLRLVDDGTAADSLGCNNLVNTDDITGNIALVYRGECEFGTKAWNAETAGAIAVVIVNNIAGPPIAMGEGAMGVNVTIPTVMITNEDGSFLRGLMEQGDVELFIGSLTGVFPYNLALEDSMVALPRAAAMPALLAMGPDDYTVDVGAFISNYGSDTQDNVRLRAMITQDGATLYDEVSDPASVEPNEVIWFELPDFSQPSYEGHYEMTYMIESDQEDAFPANNEYSTTFHVGNIFSYAEVDPATGIPETDRYVIPSTVSMGWHSCVFFRHPNASRVAITGMYTNFSAHPDSTLNNNMVLGQVLQWNEEVTSFDQVPLSVNAPDVEEIAVGDHFLQEADRDQTIFIPFLEPVQLIDDQAYLFCQVTSDSYVTHGHDNDLNYNWVMQEYDVPVMVQRMDDWFGWLNVFNPPSLGVQMIDANTIGIHENDKIEVTPFPNPTADQIRIPLAGHSGAVLVEIFDMAGAKVAERRTNIGGEQLVMDLNGISNGTYMFNMAFENGKRANFRVVVSR